MLGVMAQPPQAAALTPQVILPAAATAPLIVGRATESPSVIAAGPMRVPAPVAVSLARASSNSGVDLGLLVGVASRESSFRPDAEADTSSAAGLFQFIESTWLGAVRDFGARHGLAREAGLISASGKVKNPDDRDAILALRHNHAIAAALAAEMLRRDARIMGAALDRQLTAADLYASHFLGVRKAVQLARLTRDQPGALAAKKFPAAARANRGIFYDRKGKRRQPRTVAAVYERLALPYAAETETVAQQIRRLFGDALQPGIKPVNRPDAPPPATPVQVAG